MTYFQPFSILDEIYFQYKICPFLRQVDGQSLQGFSNHQAVEVLRHTGQLVKLRLVRFRHGPKYDKLQEYLSQANQSPPVREAVSPDVTADRLFSAGAVSNPTYDLEAYPEPQGNSEVSSDGPVKTTDLEFQGELSADTEASIKVEFVISLIQKFKYQILGNFLISAKNNKWAIFHICQLICW